jgi:Xaa-Pro aminopeptidase
MGGPYSRNMPEVFSQGHQDYDGRRVRCQQRMAALGVHAALITNLVNVRYLTGLASSNAALLLPADGRGVLATDSRYAAVAARDCGDLELVVERFVEPVLAARAQASGYRRVGFEAQEMTVQRHEHLVAGFPSLDLVPLGPMVEELRMIKDAAELGLLARACAITGAALDQVLAAMRPGVTERQVATALERAMIDLGAERPAFDSIVASGPNGASPHHAPTGRPFTAGDLVTIDCGARFGGYHADLTRTVAIGEPAAWQREIYQVVAAAQAAGLRAATDGMSVAALDAVARDVIAAAGFAEFFQHGLGHGVGLEIHEAPMIGYGKAGRLENRVPVTVEPGIYLPGRGGVRIEDTLVVRAGAAGSAELLTTTTRELLVL